MSEANDSPNSLPRAPRRPSVPRCVWVLGRDVSRSGSPAFHNDFYSRVALPWRYSAWSLAPERLTEALRALWRNGCLGCNLTNPLKELAWRYLCQETDGAMRLALSPEARRLGSVNTVAVSAAGLTGYSTDGPGWGQALEERFGENALSGRTVVLLGAGGAARAVLVEALHLGAAEVAVVNRSVAKAKSLVEELGNGRCRYAGTSWSGPLPAGALVVQATSCRGTELRELFCWQSPPAGVIASDLVYGTAPSDFLTQAQEYGVPCQDGWAMLHRQAELAIEIWRNSCEKS